MCVLPRLSSCSTLCFSAPSPSALFLLLLLPSITWVFASRLLLLWLLSCFIFREPSADWWLITPARLIRGDDSVFSSPQLKHYRQTHSFIIWGGKAFSTSTYGGQRFLWRRGAALLFSGTDGATNIRKISLLYLATVGNMNNFYSNKRKVGVSYRLYFSTLIVQCYLWARVCLWRLYTVFLGFIWCFLLFCMYFGLYSLVIFAYFINIDVCALSP